MQGVENDLYLLFNMAYDGLNKTNLISAAKETDLEDVQDFLQGLDDKPQVAVIHTKNKLYPHALIFRKVVDGKAVLFAFWKRGSVCEAMAASLDGASVLNEFIWVQDAQTGKFKAALKPKVDANKKKERQDMMVRAAIGTVVVESLNRAEYRDKFGGDIVKKLQSERLHILDDMKTRGLIPQDAIDPALRVIAASAATAAKSPAEDKKEMHDEFVAVQKGGSVVFTTHTVSSEDAGSKLAKELEREARRADRDEALGRG